jgi:hypothetical protein
MPDLVVRIKKKTDGAAALSCLRADGTTTWQRQEGQLGHFFPLHDLTHYTVETVLRFRGAFYGLVASGWDLTDFSHPWPKGRVPHEGMLAEVVVGFFDLERMTGDLSDAAELNARLDDYCAENELPRAALRLTDDDVARIRAVRAELFARWRALPAGETLELPFDVPADPTSARV